MIDPGPIPPALDRRPFVWTYTSLNTYRNVCAHQMQRRYIVRDIPYVESPQMKRGNDVHEALEKRVAGGKPLPESMHAYEPFAIGMAALSPKCEMRLAVTKTGHPCDFFAKDVWGRGKADVVAIKGDTAYLADWKTGKIREDPFELEVQALLLHAKHPHLKKIKGQFIWLAENTLGPVHDLSDTRVTWQTVCHLVSLIEADKAKGIFDKEPGPLCGWCGVMDCEHNKKRA